jgi:hypothetical protein
MQMLQIAFTGKTRSVSDAASLYIPAIFSDRFCSAREFSAQHASLLLRITFTLLNSHLGAGEGHSGSRERRDGYQLSSGNRALPEPASKAIAAATTQALNTALRVALRTMHNEPKAASSYLHKALAATSGALGGSFGLAALPIELPISTVIMLRSIGDIARAEGEDLRDPETALSCLQVFALGGLKGEVDAANSGCFAVRGLLAKSVAEATRFIVDRGVLAEGGPVLVRLLAQIASRFGVVVTQKLAAQAVPIIGALGGAAVNYAFIDHFQEIARGHFTVRRLERRYGKDTVRTAYDKLSGATLAAA